MTPIRRPGEAPEDPSMAAPGGPAGLMDPLESPDALVAGGGALESGPQVDLDQVPTADDMMAEEPAFGAPEGEAVAAEVEAYARLLQDEEPVSDPDALHMQEDEDILKVFDEYVEECSSWRAAFEPRWLKSWMDWWQRMGGDASQWRSKMFLPYSYTQHVTWLANMMSTIWRSPSLFGVRSTKPQKEKNANNFQRLLEWQMKVKASAYRHLESWLFWAGLCGSAYLRTGWKYRTKVLRRPEPVQIPDLRTGEMITLGTRLVNRSIVLDDHPFLRAVNPWNMWIAPYASDDEDEIPYTLERVETTEQRLLQEARSGALEPDAEERIKSWLAEVADNKDESSEAIAFANSRAEALRAVGLQGPYDTSTNMAQEKDAPRRSLILYELRSADYCILISGVGPQRVLSKGPNRFIRADVPYVGLHFQRVPGIPNGRGIGDVTGPIQSQLNFNYNHSNDTAQLRLDAPMLVRRSGNALVEGGIKQITPGQVIPVRDPMTDVKPVEIPETLREALLMEDHLSMHGDKATGVTEMSRGATQRGVNTATEASIIESFVGMRKGAQVDAINLAMARLGRWLIALDQQYLSSEQIVRVTGALGVDEFHRVKPEDIAGEFDIVPAASLSKSNPTLQRQDMAAVLPILAQSPFVDQAQLVRELLMTFEWDIDRIDRLVLPPPAPVRDPEVENALLEQGIPVEPSTQEDQMAHLMSHNQLLLALQAAPPPHNMAAISVIQQHMQATAEIFAVVQAAQMAAAGGGGAPPGPGGGSAPPEAGASPGRRQASALGAAQGSNGQGGRSPGPAGVPGRPAQGGSA